MNPRQVKRPNRRHLNAGYTPLYRDNRRPVKSRQFKLAPLLSALIMIALLGVLIKGLRINNVEVVGLTNKTVLEQGSRQWLSEHPQWLFGVEADLLESFLEKTYPAEADEIIVKPNLWAHKIIVTATPRSAVLAWESGNSSYLLDKEGIVLSLGTKNLPKVKDLSNLPLKVGDKAVPTQFVNFVTSVSREFTPVTKLALKSMEIEETTRELIVNSANFKVRFDTSVDHGLQLESIKRVLKVSKAAPPTSYIDVRIPHKAYYR